MLWRMAWRNMWRHRTRSAIMASAVGGTYGLMLVGLSISYDSHERMLQEAAKAAGGDVLIHGEGYWETRAADRVIRDADPVVERVRRVDGVSAVLPRVLINGLVSSARGNRPVLLRAVDVEAEKALDDPTADLSEGVFLDPGVRGPIVLGVGIVEDLDLEIGDRVVLTTTRVDGEVTRALFHLSGTIESGLRELDASLGYATLDAARAVLGLEGGLTQVGILADDDARLDSLTAGLRASLASIEGLEVVPWPEAVPEMVGFIELDDAFGYIYMAVIFAVVLFAITNTFLMAVMERVREFGLLSALGLRGGRIGSLLLAETALLTALSIVCGFALGFAAHAAVAHWGLDVAAWGIEEMEISGIDLADMVIYSRIPPLRWGVATLFVALTTVASASYPAWRAARLAPAEAMRFFE